jgi:hypothetical protein
VLNEACSLLHRFDDLDSLFQQTVDHLTRRDALIGCSRSAKIIVDVGRQINWQASLGVWAEKLAALALGEVIFGFIVFS